MLSCVFMIGALPVALFDCLLWVADLVVCVCLVFSIWVGTLCWLRIICADCWEFGRFVAALVFVFGWCW